MSTQRLIEVLVRGRWFLLGAAGLLALLAWDAANEVRFDRSIENMFAPDDPLLEPYHHLKERFGGNEIVLVVYSDDELFSRDGEGIARLAQISSRLQQIDGVLDTLSLAQIDESLKTLTTVGRFSFGDDEHEVPIVDPDDPLAKRFRALFADYTHSADGETAAVVCMLVPENETDVARKQTIDTMRSVLSSLPEDLQPAMLAGEPVMVVDGFRYIEEDGERLGWASTILLAATIIICFRSLRWVLIPIAVVQLTLLLTRAVLVWFGLRLSMVSSMLTAIVTVVGIATVVHIIVRFREAREAGMTAREALVSAGTLLALPIFWACATDAIGFLSLMLAEVGPVQDFGIMMAIGAMLVLLSVVLVIPGLTLLGSFDTDPKRAWGEGVVETQLQRGVRWVERSPRALLGGLTVLVAIAAAGTVQLEVETDFTKNFREGSPIVRSYQFIEEKLGGAGAWDILLPAPARLDAQYLQRVRRLEERLRRLRFRGANGQSTPALTKIISLADADAAAQTVSLLKLVPAEVRLQGMSQAMPNFVAALRTREPDASGQHYLRVMLRSPERQSAEQKRALIEAVTRIAREEFPETATQPAAEVTGFYVLLTSLIQSMLRDQWICFGAATAGIGGMMWIAFRSLRLALIALVPNAFPIFVVLGLMGWLQLKMNMGAAMIAAVSMGLSVDSSIHYITSFLRARRSGLSVVASLESVQQTVGRAVVFSTLALIVGFTVLCLSQFVPTIYFGTLVSLSMLGGLFGNLLVLPLLLYMWMPDNQALPAKMLSGRAFS